MGIPFQLQGDIPIRPALSNTPQSPFSRLWPVEAHLHLFSTEALEVLRLLQHPVGPGGGHLQGIASLDGVRLIQCVGQGRDTASQSSMDTPVVLVDRLRSGDATAASLTYHIPKGAARCLCQRLRQLGHQIGHFRHGLPPVRAECAPIFSIKKSGAAAPL